MSARPPASRSGPRPKTTVLTLQAKRDQGEAIVMATAHDYPTARQLETAGLDAILVGDSLAMVALGHPDTLSVTMEEMLHHARAVSRGAQTPLLVGDMPFMSYQVNPEQALRNAGRFLQEAGMDAVKLEGGRAFADTVRAIVRAGIPVMGHLGLTPQSVKELGGFRVQGRTAASARAILDDALALQEAGCFAIVLEAVPERLATFVTERLRIPTIGIGAGAGTSGQVLVTNDLLGFFDDFTPKFAKRYAQLGETAGAALAAYRDEVKTRAFPTPSHAYGMPDEQWQEFLASVPQVLVVGTGAMASLFAARLQRFGGARVCLTGTWRAALDAVVGSGIQVEDGSGHWSAKPDVVALTSPLPAADLVLVLVKGHQTAAVAPAVARAVRPTGLVLTLQNGLGNREILEATIGPGRVSVGVATVGATLLGPGRVRATPGSVVLGAADPPAPGLCKLEQLLTASGFKTSLEENIERTVWRKLAVNCAINPLTALHGCPNGGLLQIPEARETLVQAAREVGAVAAALGIDLQADPALLAVAVAERTAANRSSMLQDIERGAPTEIESLNGAVVREARRLGVAVPVNESLRQHIREREAVAAQGVSA